MKHKKIYTTGPFTNFITNTLNMIGMGNQDLSNDNKIMSEVKQRAKDISSQTLLNTLNENPSKLDLFSTLKTDHKFEKYLHINNFEHRRAITKLRTSSHKPEIETGRWSKIPRENRICKNCALNKIEDEYHLIFECQMHITERKNIF